MFDTQHLELAQVEVSSARPEATLNETLEAEAIAMADEIIAEIIAETAVEGQSTCAIKTDANYSDIAGPEELQAERVARLKRLVAAGEYEFDALDVAEALFDSGDLS